MNSRTILCFLACCLTFSACIFFASCPEAGAAEMGRPNIVMILADDLGYGDITEKWMPRCTELASRGTRMNLYAHQNCMPTRAALFTGRYPHRYGLYTVWPTPVDPGLPVDEQILSERLADAGYQCGMFGKWHLGWRDKNQWPSRRGFKEFIGCLGGHINSYGTRQVGFPFEDGSIGHDHHGAHDMQWNEVPIYTSEYSTKLFGDAAVRFVEKHANKPDPFFLYVPFNAPHGPFSAPREYVEAAQVIGGFDPSLIDLMTEYSSDVIGVPPAERENAHATARLLYAAMIMALDDAVGDIYETIEKQGIADNTLFVFCSDNGVSYTFDPDTKALTLVGSSGPLRGQKGSHHEGGSRVANFLIWPDRVSPGQKVSSNVWIGDLTATFLDVAKASKGDPDGASIVPALDRDQRIVRQFGAARIMPMVMRYPYTPPGNSLVKELCRASVVSGSRKYVRTLYRDGTGKTIFTNEEMYDLARDIGETRNISGSQHPAHKRWLFQSRIEFGYFGGDELFDSIPDIPRSRIWAGYEATTDFGIPDGTAILETSINP